MQLNSLLALSPVDGRYFSATQTLVPYFSEFGLNRYRVRVEVEYFIALCEWGLPELKEVPNDKFPALRNIYITFSKTDALAIKEIEKTTNHDVKAVEYFVKNHVERAGLGKFKEFVHFGLTSQDINNTAIPLSMKQYLADLHLPALNNLVSSFEKQALAWKDRVMLARTHGQPASPTRLGKEIAVFSERIKKQLILLGTIPHSAKLGGATGNFNAHVAAYPDVDWKKFADQFVNERLGLVRSHPTTQVEHYDNMAAQFDNLKRINTILTDYCRDMWHYVSLNYFKQQLIEGEVGSSAMPHKVNPIDFENAEGNLGFANAVFEHLSSKLPVSRLQRDLTDSTVLRNIGVPLAHSLVAFQSIMKGIEKLELNPSALDKDLEDNWAVVAEAIQTILRKEGYPNPYEALKELTRKNEKITRKDLEVFIDRLKISDALKVKLKGITPFNYTGL